MPLWLAALLLLFFLGGGLGLLLAGIFTKKPGLLIAGIVPLAISVMCIFYLVAAVLLLIGID